MKTISLFLLLISLSSISKGQFYSTKNGFIGFYSKTILEDIAAENKQLYAIINVSKKTVAFSMLLKGFQFKKELMQEHFNENYAESDTYPKATFTGSFTETIDPLKDRLYTLHLSGTITLHGVSKPFTTTADVDVRSRVLYAHASFNLLPGDFNISIPSIVKEKIADKIHVEVKASLH